MSATLNYDLKRAPTSLFESGRWDVLTQLIIHSNGRNRCWPTVRRLKSVLGKSTSTINEAKKWLIDAQAMRQVPYELRMDKEKKLPKRQCVYELTGKLVVEGVEIQYLYINHEDNGDTEDVSLGKTYDVSPSEISLSENKVLEDKESNTNTSKESTSPPATVETSKQEIASPSKPDLKTTPPPTPSPPEPPKVADAEKNAIAVLCYGTVDAWKDKRYASAMMQALKRLKSFTPGMNETTIEAFGRDWNKNDFRGKQGQRAKPHQVADEWLAFKERCGKDPACNGTGKDMQTDYVRIPHPDPNLAAHGVMKTVHRSELEAKKT